MWARLRKKSDAQVLAEARADPDARPVEDRKTGSLGPVRRVSLAKRARWKAGFSQEEFARQFGFPLGTLRDWEQHRTKPNQAMMNYLKLILDDPKTVTKTLAMA